MKIGEDMYEKIILDNGVRIVHEKIDYVRSASLGIWVDNGSRYEPANLNGISHFIEHMLFKGTENRTDEDIAQIMDGLGGQINAFTGKECTSYYLKALNTHLSQGIDVLADMFFNSKFDEKDVNTERTVIAEEIGMYEDSPEDMAVEKLFEACFETSPLGSPILGTKDTIANINSDNMKKYLQDYYKPKGTVVSLCGSYSDKELNLLCDAFGKMKGNGVLTHDTAQYNQKFITRVRDYEQNHLCLGFESIDTKSEDRYTLQLLGAMLGGGMSSRLFREVREKHGLCYSVYTFNTSHLDTGLFSIYTALNPSTEQKALKLIKNVIADFCEKGPEEAELSRVREQVKANIIMGLESTNMRMNSTARGELFLGKCPTSDELIDLYNSVTAEQIQNLAQKIFNYDKVSLCAVGKPITQSLDEIK